MHLELREVHSVWEMPALMDCYLRSSATPPSPFTHLVSPVTDTSERAHADRVANFAARQWFGHCMDPSSRLVKVVDTDAADKVVGLSRWNIHERDPYESGQPKKISVFWMPESPARRYAEAVLKNLELIRFRRRPHVLCSYALTLPEYRRCGAGRLMLQWAMQRADELGLESYVEGSPMGTKLYLQFGFRIDRVVTLEPDDELEEDNAEWRDVKASTKGLSCAVLRRPVGGVWNEPDDKGFPEADFDKNIWKAPAV